MVTQNLDLSLLLETSDTVSRSSPLQDRVLVVSLQINLSFKCSGLGVYLFSEFLPYADLIKFDVDTELYMHTGK